MRSTNPSPKPQNVAPVQDAQKELNRLHRRRLALIQLIRSVEEYLLVTDVGDPMLTDTAPASASPKKPNLRVVYTRSLKQLMA